MAAKKTVGVRVSTETADWIGRYSQERGVSSSDLLATAIEEFRENCEAGVPDIRAAIRRQTHTTPGQAETQGVGDCPGRDGTLGHVWHMTEDGVKVCRFCPMEGKAFLDRASEERAAVFARLRTPASAHGKAKK